MSDFDQRGRTTFARAAMIRQVIALVLGLGITATLSRAADPPAPPPDPVPGLSAGCATNPPSAQHPCISMNPSTFVPGKSYTVTILAAPSPCTNYSLNGATIVATGAGISFPAPTTPSKHDCDWTGTLTVAQDADVGNFNIVVPGTTESTLIPIVVAAKAAGPIPPGMQPTVDVAWDVLPRRISSDNFGARITKLYYPIEVVIGNNSGYDLQLASVQFKLPDDKLKNYVPSDSYYVVRSTLQREQLIGARNATINIIKAIGPILTGSAVFYNGASIWAAHRKSNFQGFTDLFSNPFEKGFEMVFPDQTVQQLINLDNHTLRDGMIIPNNTQIRSIVFINKDLLQKSADGTDATAQREMAKKLGSNTMKHEYDQQEVMKKLGSLELVGRPITYLNRVSVISNPPGAGPAFTLSPTSIVQDDASIKNIALTLTGDGLTGGTLVSSDPTLLVLSSPKVGDGGKSFTATMDASNAPPKKYTLTLTTSSASQSAIFEVKPADITITTPSPAISIKAGDPKSVQSLTGTYLENATGTPTSDCKDVVLALEPPASTAPKIKVLALNIDITVPASVTATTCKVTVTGASGKTATFPITVTH